MKNIIELHYKDAKEKVKNMDADFHYNVDLCNALCQVVRIDDFEKKCNNIDYDIFQSIKLFEGVVGLGKVGGKLYCIFDITEVGLPNNTMHYDNVIGSYYDESNELHVEEFKVGKNIVLWYNNPFGVGENDIYKYADMLSEIDTSISIAILKTRDTDIFEVSNETEKQELLKSIRETKNGEPIVFVNKRKNSLVDEEHKKETINDVENSEYIQYLSHLYDNILSRFCNKNGISVNMGSSKQAQQTVNEVDKVDAYSWLNPISMLFQCQKFCGDVKELYDIDLTCHFGIVHEKNFEKFYTECTADDADNDVQTESNNVSRETSEESEETDNENQND